MLLVVTLKLNFPRCREKRVINKKGRKKEKGRKEET